MGFDKVKLIKLEPGNKYQRLLNKDAGTLGIKSGHVILQPGENVGKHSTGEREEVIIFLDGAGEAVIGKQDVLKIEKGIVLYIPPDTEHDIRNTGSGILEYVFVISRAQDN